MKEMFTGYVKFKSFMKGIYGRTPHKLIIRNK